jgi:molybdopterin/thiamine biosynthesis adenylyltransferase
MALAAYYDRAALAASQVLSGFDSSLFQSRLEGVVVAVGFDDEVCQSPAGLALLDMLIRLLARLYPSIRIDSSARCADTATGLRELARQINPAIGLDGEVPASVGIWVGRHPRPIASRLIYAGCTSTDGLVSNSIPRAVERSGSPFGAGGAACVAAANLFRLIFLGESAEVDVASSIHMIDEGALLLADRVDQPVVLVGGGAIGNAFAWAFNHNGSASLHIVDPEEIELSNLQRYVLATPEDVAKSKVAVIASRTTPGFDIYKYQLTWEQFAASYGYSWHVVAAAVDSARARRRIQQSLPQWIANAWTQPGDLGVSTHVFDGPGACLACLYLPQGPSENEDTIVANQLRIPDQIMKVRELLYTGEGLAADLIDLIAERLDVDKAQAMNFVGRSIRDLYTEGVCGGALVALGGPGSLRGEVHVPLAHQSALAGLLLAAAVLEHLWLHRAERSTIRRLDIMRRLPPRQEVLPVMKDPRGICLCQDPVYQRAYRAKYSADQPPGKVPKQSRRNT